MMKNISLQKYIFLVLVIWKRLRLKCVIFYKYLSFHQSYDILNKSRLLLIELVFFCIQRNSKIIKTHNIRNSKSSILCVLLWKVLLDFLLKFNFYLVSSLTLFNLPFLCQPAGKGQKSLSHLLMMSMRIKDKLTSRIVFLKTGMDLLSIGWCLSQAIGMMGSFCLTIL